VEPLSSDRAVSRLNLLLWIALIWAVAILGRLVDLQILSHGELRRLADSQHLHNLEVSAPRGAIFDRNGRPLAMSLPVDSVAVDPRQIKDLPVAAEVLAGVLDLDGAGLLEKLKSAADGPTRRGFLWIKRKISREESERLRGLKLDWVEFRQESQRYYPKGTLAAHLLGGVDHEEKGNAGIEMALDDELQGLPGSVRMLTDVKQRGYASEVFVEPQPGRNLTLTLHEGIQYVAERELKIAVEDNQCQTGSIVVMDPRTGDVLALANYPTYDPNEAVQPGGKGKEARFNLAASVPFEPGSVFKVITVAAALETTPLTPASIIPCGNGKINLFGRLIRDHNSYSSLSMADVLAKSSNIGAIQIGLRVGDARMYEYVKRFGFGKTTGVPVPAESGGMVRRVSEWEPSSIGSVAMGHEVSTTTLQLARACSVIANGGLLVRPRLILAHQKPGGKVEAEPIEQPKRILKPETAITTRQMMEGVVLHGTGTKAHLDGYTAGGKTGSAQIFDLEKKVYTHRYNASFMGFAPVANPSVVVVVTLNGASKYGGAVAAPVFREVATTALRLMDVRKDLPEGVSPDTSEPTSVDDLAIADLSSPPPAPPATVPAATGGALPASSPAGLANVQAVGPAVPDFKGKTMRAVLEQSAALGLPVEVQGSGLARAQAPPAGTLLAIGERVRVQFAR
jgi:cell division protein FtsI (penicillin-binding protein 3)